MTESLPRIAGLSAYANAALSLLNIVTLILLFTAGGPWGAINDGLSVFWVLSFGPIVLLLFRLHRPGNPLTSLVTTLVALAAVVAFAGLQFLLVIRVVTFEQTIGSILTLGGLLGLSLFLFGLLARAGGTLPPRIAWALMVFGLSYAVTAVGFGLGGMWHPLVTGGFAVGTVAGLLWAVWLGRLLLGRSGALVTAFGAGEF